MTEQRPPTFAQGVLAGFGGALVLALFVLAYEYEDYARMYRDIGGINVRLPALTKLTLSPIWLWGVPALGAAAVGYLVIRRPRSGVLYACVAGLLVVATAMTWYYPRAPIMALAGNISG